MKCHTEKKEFVLVQPVIFVDDFVRDRTTRTKTKGIYMTLANFSSKVFNFSLNIFMELTLSLLRQKFWRIKNYIVICISSRYLLREHHRFCYVLLLPTLQLMRLFKKYWLNH